MAWAETPTDVALDAASERAPRAVDNAPVAWASFPKALAFVALAPDAAPTAVDCKPVAWA